MAFAGRGGQSGLEYTRARSDRVLGRLVRRRASLPPTPGPTWNVSDNAVVMTSATGASGRCQIFTASKPAVKLKNWKSEKLALRLATCSTTYIDQMDNFGKLVHSREPYDVNNQVTIRANRDTLYSFGVFDVTSPLTVTLTEPGNRYQSLMVINQDHSIAAEYGPKEIILDKNNVGTWYVFLAIRTFMDPNDEADIKAAHELQDSVLTRQDDKGSFDVPDWKKEAINLPFTY